MWQFWLRSALAVLLGAASQWAAAVTFIDLTTAGSTATVNGAIFTVPGPAGVSGSGLIDSFVRIQATGTEQGYNTSDRPVQFNEQASLTFTHDITIGALSTNKVTVGGIEYYEFVLDTNEGGGPNSLLSLDKLEFFEGPSTTNTATCLAGGGYVSGSPSGTLCGLSAVYSLDGPTALTADNYSIKLDSALHSGSGQLDLIVLVPTALFGTTVTDKVYLYSQFGTFQNTGGGFEEWAHKLTGTFTDVPVPGTVLLFGAGLLVMGALRRRTRA